MALEKELDKEKLRSMTPEERMRFLRKFEEDRKKQLEETGKLIRETFEELKVPEDDEPPEPEPVLNLESELESQPPREQPEEDSMEYMVDIYGRMKELKEGMQSQGSSYQTLYRMRELNDAIQGRMQYESQNEKMKDIAHAAERMLDEIDTKYERRQDYFW